MTSSAAACSTRRRSGLLSLTPTRLDAPAPTYVLLVGDGHYDFGPLWLRCGQHVPPYLGMVDPWWGETAADNRYAAVVGDDTCPT